MPWSDNNGNGGNGSRGSNNGPTRGPWGKGPRGPQGGGEPPDLEELLQASRQRLKRAFPRGGGGGGGRGGGGIEFNQQTAFIGGAVALGLFLFNCAYVVNPGEQAVVTTFGKYSTVTGPGLNWRIPVVQQAEKVAVEQQQTANVGFSANRRGQASSQENLMLTSDRNIVDISFSVDWKVDQSAPQGGEKPNVAKFIFNVDDPVQMVKAVSEAAMRDTIGSSELDPIITSGQAVVTEQTRIKIQEVLNFYDSGIEVLRVNMEKPEPPAAVRDAFVDVVKARSEKERTINEAELAANQIIPVAEGRAQQIIEQARAYAARVESESLGEAERFSKIYEEYRRAPEVTRQRMYLETVEKVLGDMNKIIIEDDAGSGVVPYLPLNELNRQQSN